VGGEVERSEADYPRDTPRSEVGLIADRAGPLCWLIPVHHTSLLRANYLSVQTTLLSPEYRV
jgi:hypothetical protein